MIKLGTIARTVRECTAPFEYTDEKGERQVEQIPVQYLCLTTAEIKNEKAAQTAKREEDPRYVPYDTEYLLPRLHALPSIADAKGKALSRENGNLTIENLDLIETANITAIWKAIGQDMVPKDQPSTSQSGGSSAKN